MPEICRFYGIVIAMFYRDHQPPHFHARYQGAKTAIEIDSLQIIEGWLPTTAEALVMEWASSVTRSFMRTGSWHAVTLRSRESLL